MQTLSHDPDVMVPNVIAARLALLQVHADQTLAATARRKQWLVGSLEVSVLAVGELKRIAARVAPDVALQLEAVTMPAPREDTLTDSSGAEPRQPRTDLQAPAAATQHQQHQQHYQQQQQQQQQQAGAGCPAPRRERAAFPRTSWRWQCAASHQPRSGASAQRFSTHCCRRCSRGYRSRSTPRTPSLSCTRASARTRLWSTASKHASSTTNYEPCSSEAGGQESTTRSCAASLCQPCSS
jgi:hypothetical protein